MNTTRCHTSVGTCWHYHAQQAFEKHVLGTSWTCANPTVIRSYHDMQGIARLCVPGNWQYESKSKSVRRAKRPAKSCQLDSKINSGNWPNWHALDFMDRLENTRNSHSDNTQIFKRSEGKLGALAPGLSDGDLCVKIVEHDLQPGRITTRGI